MKITMTVQSIIKDSLALLFADKKRTGIFFVFILICELVRQYMEIRNSIDLSETRLVDFHGLYIILVYTLAVLILQSMYTYTLQHTTISIHKSFFAVQPFLVKVILVSLMVILATTLGLLLFVIPAFIILATWFIIIPLILIENKSVFGSLSESRKRTKGYRYTIFFACVPYIILSIVGMSLFSVSHITVPAMVVSALLITCGELYLNTLVYIVYKQLSSYKEIV